MDGLIKILVWLLLNSDIWRAATRFLPYFSREHQKRHEILLYNTNYCCRIGAILCPPFTLGGFERENECPHSSKPTTFDLMCAPGKGEKEAEADKLLLKSVLRVCYQRFSFAWDVAAEILCCSYTVTAITGFSLWHQLPSHLLVFLPLQIALSYLSVRVQPSLNRFEKIPTPLPLLLQGMTVRYFWANGSLGNKIYWVLSG